jgi:hypothetical protein
MTRRNSNPSLRKSAIHPNTAITMAVPLVFAEPAAQRPDIHFIDLEESMEPC